MPDPYRFDPTPTPSSEPTSGGGVLGVLLWVVFVLCLAVNAVTSLTGAPVLLSAGFGALALASLVLLVTRYARARR
ncbi:hypothetical protein [Halostreptopolyspora alba]|uniref:hypothetical protein n=1 Tax=Halostreptopolyspora alba TaxID=2487137 RepID=UPI0011CE1AD3